MGLMENLGIILIVSIVTIASTLIILLTVEKKLKKRLKKKNRNKFYISEINKIDKSDPEKILKSIDKIARKFFEEAFKIKNFAGYSELKKSFNQKKNIKAVEFCDIITTLLYSKEKNHNKIQRLLDLLIEIVESNQIISNEEQMETEKTNAKISLRKMNIPSISKKKLKNKKHNRKNN